MSPPLLQEACLLKRMQNTSHTYTYVKCFCVRVFLILILILINFFFYQIQKFILPTILNKGLKILITE